MSQLIEFIESYKKIGNDYQWNDNHGELVRCKDCKHRFDGEHIENCCEVLMSKAKWWVEIPVDDNWYCGDGERKEE